MKVKAMDLLNPAVGIVVYSNINCLVAFVVH